MGNPSVGVGLCDQENVADVMVCGSQGYVVKCTVASALAGLWDHCLGDGQLPCYEETHTKRNRGLLPVANKEPRPAKPCDQATLGSDPQPWVDHSPDQPLD